TYNQKFDRLNGVDTEISFCSLQRLLNKHGQLYLQWLRPLLDILAAALRTTERMVLSIFAKATIPTGARLRATIATWVGIVLCSLFL
ncbi:MAG TPA: hypothetical protein PLZ44_09160, partial [Methanothrix sp.]|nr:hypothetical protein [Methanothrix sp.]